MNEPMLCCVALFFLGWVVFLKYQMGLLRSENDELRKRLKTQVKKAVEGADVVRGPGVSGHKPQWMG